MSKACNNCGGDCGGENSWDIAEINGLCQMCYEDRSEHPESSKLCTTCGNDGEVEDLWDISASERLCQMCWEKSCGESFWEFFGSVDDVTVAIGIEEEGGME